MELIVNGEPTDVDEGTTLGRLVDGFGRGRAGVAVACNDDVVPRGEWDATVLAPGDRIEVLTVARGG